MSNHQRRWCRTRSAETRNYDPHAGPRLRLLPATGAVPKSDRQTGDEEELRALIKSLNGCHHARLGGRDDDLPPAAA